MGDELVDIKAKKESDHHEIIELIHDGLSFDKKIHFVQNLRKFLSDHYAVEIMLDCVNSADFQKAKSFFEYLLKKNYFRGCQDVIKQIIEKIENPQKLDENCNSFQLKGINYYLDSLRMESETDSNIAR